MNIDKLRQAECEFYLQYPLGMDDPEMIQILRKHKMVKMRQMAQSSFAPEQFADPAAIVQAMGKIVVASSLISVFDKPKFRDLVAAMTFADKTELAAGLKLMLYGDRIERAAGFEQMVNVLGRYKMASWSLVTVVPAYFDGQRDVCLKPNTVKAIIDFYELDGLVYRTRPDYAFYEAYRDELAAMRSQVPAYGNSELIAFSGMLFFAMPKAIPKRNSPDD